MKILLVLLFSLSALAQPMLTVTGCGNCKGKELPFILEATKKMNQVVVSQCFRDEMTKMSMIQTNGKTPSQVVDSLIHADVKIEARMYYTWKRVLGYTLEGVNKEWINRKYMLSWSLCDLGSLLVHESSHKVGYTHNFYSTKRRPQSVPYSSNTAFDKCCTAR